jgi:hypothetical protein
MKKIFALLLFLVAWGSIALNAQTILNNTTLSTAIGDTRSNIAVVASATGITAPNPADPTKTTFLVIDAEMVQVVSVSGANLNVARGVNGTQAHTHASGALVLVVPGYLGTYFVYPPPTGSCTRGNQIALPVVSIGSTIGANQAVISDCLGGQWVNGDAGQTTRSTFYRLEAPTIGAVANNAALGTSTATVAAELYCTEIRLPYSRLLTGLAPHIGATGGTDKWIVALYDSGGNLIANSAVAGATVSGTAYAWQATAFTAPYYAVGPAQYYGCLMSNGTTATADLIKTTVDDNTLTFKSASAGTFGTLPNFTAPTAFTTVNGPFLYAY